MTTLPSTPDAVPLSLARTLILALEHRATLIRSAVTCAILGAGIGLALPRHWTSVVSFVPSADNSALGSLASVAGQFGLSLPGGATQQSPEFYSTLITSHHILGSVVRTPLEARTTTGLAFWTRDTVVNGTFADLYGITGPDSARVDAKAEQRLRKQLGVSVDDQTGVTKVSVDTRWPDVSAELAQRILALVQEFDTESRQSQAGAERKFTEARLAQAEQALGQAEDAAIGFVLRNQQIRNPSPLQLQLERLQREVSMRQQVVTGLRQAYEQARLEEVRNTPQITVIESGNRPALPEPRGLALKVILGAVLGAGIGLLWVLGRDWLAWVAANPEGEPHRLLVASRAAWRELAQAIPFRRRADRGTP